MSALYDTMVTLVWVHCMIPFNASYRCNHYSALTYHFNGMMHLIWYNTEIHPLISLTAWQGQCAAGAVPAGWFRMWFARWRSCSQAQLWEKRHDWDPGIECITTLLDCYWGLAEGTRARAFRHVPRRILRYLLHYYLTRRLRIGF